MKRLVPRYPVYVLSKGRYSNCLTAKFLTEDRTPFYLVVEPQEYDKYREHFPKAKILVLPWNDPGSGVPVRNWIWEHSKAQGDERHWILDDNSRYIAYWYRNKRIRCDANIALSACEDFVDRYENIAIAGLNYTMFGIKQAKKKPITVNCHVYSCLLIRNDLPYRWRGRYNEDTDLCLQVLANGWCTVLINTFLINKMATMTMKGGNTASLYAGNGRLRMARALERLWPGVVTVKRRFRRPQHYVLYDWKRFTTPLVRKKKIRFNPKRYKMQLVAVSKIESPYLRKMLAEFDGV